MNVIKVVIPSRKRIGKVAALKVFPDATLCVCEDEEAAYREAYPENEMLVHPVGITMMAPLRQWILDNVEERYLLQCNDDVVYFQGHAAGWYKRFGPDEALRVVQNTAECADAMGASVFGFNQAWDVRKFVPQKPFTMNTWVGGVVGYVGRKHKYDPKLLLRADIDFCLTCLLRDRITWCDLRYSFFERRFAGEGGNARNRSAARHEKEMEYLKRKWGHWLAFVKVKSTTRLVVRVPR